MYLEKWSNLMVYLNVENAKVIKQNTVNVKLEVQMNLLQSFVIVTIVETDGDFIKYFFINFINFYKKLI